MFRLILLILGQSVLLVASQTFLKIALQHFGVFSWTWNYFKTVFTTWQFATSGIAALAAMFTWFYVLKHYEFSIAYPLLSISYIIGLLSAYFFLHETITLSRWLGVVIIMVGVYFVVK
jgi:undecaprenyl phosphate-alpha-L-ara4N flippase subunit ArnE